MIFVVTLTEILFTSSAACLGLDFFSKKLGRYRPYAIGIFTTAALLLSLAIMLLNWSSYLGKTITSQPVASAYSSIFLSDSYTLFIIFLVLIISIASSVYSAFWLKPESNVGPYFSLLLVLTCSIIGVASAGDLLTLFLFWEGMSLASYGLVSFRKNYEFALEASLKYFFIVGLGSLVALFGISIIYSLTGNLQLASLGLLDMSNPLSSLALAMTVLGFGAEAAVVPLHTWLPDVYSAASSPAVTMISGTVTAMGVLGPFKILQPLALTSSGSPLSFRLLLILVSLFTMLIGNLGGLYQTNLRRMLGYSSIAQTGYLLSALSTFSSAGLVAVIFLIWNHGVLKSSFFALSGSVEEGYEGADFERLRGIGKQSKLLGTLFTLSSLGMVGAPPFGLFWGELLIVESLVLAGGPYLLLAAAVALNIAVSIGYYYRVINTVVFGEPSSSISGYRADLLSVSLLLLSISLMTGLMPQLFLSLIT
ncbi:MAG: proton-conducting transporter membrane subunit [Conexivisphaerales archaeon]